MKVNKLFALAMAGMAFAACSNDDDFAPQKGNEFTPNGTGAVTVKLVNPTIGAARALVDQTTGNDPVAVTGTVTVTLTDLVDGKEETQKMELNAANIDNNDVLTFWNVTNPQKIEVSINGGVADYAEVAPSTLQTLPGVVPAYGKAEQADIELTGETGSPTIKNDNNNTATGEGAGNKMEQGAEEGDQNKKYQLYAAKITMAIPVARLEVSGIKHKAHPQEAGGTDVCEYSKLTIKGVYMDNVYTKGGAYTSKAATVEGGFPTAGFGNGSVAADYCWGQGLGTGTQTGILKTEIEGDDTARNFLAANTQWPALLTDQDVKQQAYAFNFYPADGSNMPKFKIYFDQSEGVSADNPKPAPRFAMISKYKNEDGTDLTKFEAGKIYRILSAELSDKNIIGDEGGNTLYGVEVTVQEAVWTPVIINAEWED